MSLLLRMDSLYLPRLVRKIQDLGTISPSDNIFLLHIFGISLFFWQSMCSSPHKATRSVHFCSSSSYVESFSTSCTDTPGGGKKSVVNTLSKGERACLLTGSFSSHFIHSSYNHQSRIYPTWVEPLDGGKFAGNWRTEIITVIILLISLICLTSDA